MQHKTAYIWGLIGKFGPQGLYLITTMILARYLTAEEFGMIGVLSIIFIVAQVLLDSGLGGSLIKEKEISILDCSSITCFNIFVSLLIYIILFFSAEWIEELYKTQGLANVVKVLSLVFPITALGIVPKSLLQRKIQFKTICWNYMLAVTIGCITSIIVAIRGGGVYALVAYQLVTNLVNVIANFICSKYRFSLKLSFSSLKRLLPFGIFTSIISIIDTIYENIMTALVGKFMNVQQAGYMYQAKRIEETMSSSLAGTIGVVTFPILTKLKDNLAEFNKEALSTMKMIACLAFPLLFTVAVFADEIIVLLFGKNWIESGFYLETLTFAGIFLILETLIRNYIKALCEVKKLMYATVVKRVVGIVIMIIALLIKPEYIVYGYILSALVGFVINSLLFDKLSHISIRSLIASFIYVLIVCFLYYVLFKLLSFTDINLWVEILLSIIILSLYYFVIMPRLGLNILSMLKLKK